MKYIDTGKYHKQLKSNKIKSKCFSSFFVLECYSFSFRDIQKSICADLLDISYEDEK